MVALKLVVSDGHGLLGSVRMCSIGSKWDSPRISGIEPGLWVFQNAPRVLLTPYSEVGPHAIVDQSGAQELLSITGPKDMTILWG